MFVRSSSVGEAEVSEGVRAVAARHRGEETKTPDWEIMLPSYNVRAHRVVCVLFFF